VRVKLDENLPQRLVSILAELGHDVDAVVREGPKGAKDDDLWPAVQRAERFLITKDLGFSDVRRYEPGTHRGIMVFRLSDDRSRVVAERLQSVFRSDPVEDWGRCLVIVTDHKVRVRRAPPAD
jgi:predicted nuclease of predicted toxin-antitoxin system